MAIPIMTEAERDEINELGEFLTAYAEKHSLTVTEMLGRLEMFKSRLWNTHFGDLAELSSIDPDEDEEEDDPPTEDYGYDFSNDS